MKNDYVIQKYEDIRGQLQKEINKEYYSSMKKADPEERITYEQYQEMLQHINYDVAWQIFDEVNENNDTEKLIDLNCLDV